MKTLRLAWACLTLFAAFFIGFQVFAWACLTLFPKWVADTMDDWVRRLR